MRVPTLLAITPGDGRALGPWVDALAHAGLPGLLIREPALDPVGLYDLAERARRRIPVVAVHDRNPHARRVAEELGLPVHLPSGAIRPAPRFTASTHTADEVDRALGAGAEWVLLSPVWRPRSKPTDAREVLGLDAFLGIAAGRPVLALAGVDAARYARLRAGGAAGAAVIGALFDEVDPVAASDALRAFLPHSTGDSASGSSLSGSNRNRSS